MIKLFMDVCGGFIQPKPLKEKVNVKSVLTHGITLAFSLTSFNLSKLVKSGLFLAKDIGTLIYYSIKEKKEKGKMERTMAM